MKSTNTTTTTVSNRLLESQPPAKGLILTGLAPENPGVAATWEKMPAEEKAMYKKNIADVLTGLRKGDISWITIGNVSYQKLPFDSDFEKNLYLRANSLKKAKFVAKEYAAFFDDIALNHEQSNLLQKFIADNINFLGKNIDNFIKLAEFEFKDNAFLLDKLKQFSFKFSKNFQDEYLIKEAKAENPSIFIATHNGGNAHKMIAEAVSDELKKISCESATFNENVQHFEHDSLKLAIGVDYASLWNFVKQKGGDEELYKLYQALEKEIRSFIEDKRGDIFDQAFNGCEIIYDSAMHSHYVRANAHFGTQVIFQICDYGKIPDQIHKLACDLHELKLSGITMTIPDADTYIVLDSKPVLLGESQGDDRFTLLPYPVGKNWTKNLTYDQVATNRANYHLGALNEKLLVMTAGGQGVTGVLEDYLERILNQAIPEIIQKIQSGKEHEITKLNIAAICGYNETMQQNLKKIILEHNVKLSNQTGQQLDKYINVQTLGYVPNENLAQLVRSADGYLTKPGGSTAAECLAAGIADRMLIHCVETHVNELENAEMLKKHGAAILSADTAIYSNIMNTHFSPMLNPPTPIKTVGNFIKQEAIAMSKRDDVEGVPEKLLQKKFHKS